MSSQYKPKEYEGYREILAEVKAIVRRIAPDWAASAIVQKIDDLETTIDEIYSGRADMAEMEESFDPEGWRKGTVWHKDNE
tara:strand:+ start:1290 stop:1532 length:243 start_codon:yes stop_codon:yes gene_type:complete